MVAHLLPNPKLLLQQLQVCGRHYKGVGNRSKAEHESETILSNYITDDKTEIKIHIKSNGTPKSANTSGPTSANPSDTERGEDDKD